MPTVFAEAGDDGVPVEARQRVPARVHEPRREPGEHPHEGSGRSRGPVRVLPMIAGVVPESFGFPPSSPPHGVLCGREGRRSFRGRGGWVAQNGPAHFGKFRNGQNKNGPI